MSMCRMNLRVQVLYRAGQGRAGQARQGKARHRDRDSVFLSCVKSSIADGARDRKEASVESRMALPFPSAPADGPPRQGRERGKKGKPSRAVGDDTAHSLQAINALYLHIPPPLYGSRGDHGQPQRAG